MAVLSQEIRRKLEAAISDERVGARTLAEAGARAAIARLGVESDLAPGGQSPEQRDLRVQLRARLRAIGKQGLVEEIAYEQWHRMLFARFLAENDLLFHPEGAPVSLAEVKELADEEGERDMWMLAARYAAAMLPGIFRADDPANRVAFAPEDRSRLEAVLEALPASLFTADDALGWVYQFWQSQRKDEVNKRGDKIGGADLPPVTQLFTEHYMVRFLLENSLGAWWAGRHPDSPLLREWEYLRFRDDGAPAAGTFEGWPARAAEVTVMDPCCGSGHFLVAAADMLRRMRSEEEGLTPAQAAVAVIRDNLFGLELDARCLQLAAFNLALDAWKAGGFQPLPIPNLACSGIAVKGQRGDWQQLAGDDDRMRQALDRLHDLFQDAPELGSLIDPRSAAGEGLWRVDTDELLSKLDRALARETASDPTAAVFGAAAAGTARAAKLLAQRYWVVATNPPFLTSAKQSEALRTFAALNYPGSKADLSTVLLDRARAMTHEGGGYGFVTPESWRYLGTFASFRHQLLMNQELLLLVNLGVRSFSTPMWDFPIGLTILRNASPADQHCLCGLDASDSRIIETKISAIRRGPITERLQSSQLGNPDCRIVTFGVPPGPSGQSSAASHLLGDFATSQAGIQTGDYPRWVLRFWEVPNVNRRWQRYQTPPSTEANDIGCGSVIRYDDLTALPRASFGYVIRGSAAWGSPGVLVGLMRGLQGSPYWGAKYDQMAAVLLPRTADVLPALLAYSQSTEYSSQVRAIDVSIKVTPATLTKVPFNLEHWTKVAAEKYPNGLPEPHSDDPTQWLFKGNIVDSEAPLQVAVARLLGYRWPDQEPDALDAFADADGLVPLPSVGGERSAAERLRDLLARAYGDAWSPALLDRLLAEAGSPGKTLETWLRDDFFAQHVKLFQNRPFIWHAWDGRKDGGFSVLCHYHRLDRARLERLTFTLLGDWIERQRAASTEPGAEARLAAALGLQDKLKLILAGEREHDIYVRWKSLAEQPMGWEPDLDDGVRLNIRPFVTADVLRSKVNVKWDKDRGKDPDGSERINDLHHTLAEKRAARAAAGR